METIGTTTTTSGGEAMDSSMLLSTSTRESESKPRCIIDFQSDGPYLPSSSSTATTATVPENSVGATAKVLEGEEEGRRSDENKTAAGTTTGNERWLNTCGGDGGQGDKDSSSGGSKEITTTPSTTHNSQSCSEPTDYIHSQVRERDENGSLDTSVTESSLTFTTKEEKKENTLSGNNIIIHPDQSTPLLSLPDIHLSSNDDDGDGGEYHHHNNNEEDDSETTTTPVVPNFCVEGSGGGDSSVTVLLGGTTLNGVSSSSCFTTTPDCLLSNDSTIDGNCCDGTDNENSIGCGGGDGGSGPISVQSSEDCDMKLSLVSWYSEPDESSRDCCKNNNSSISSGGNCLISKSDTPTTTTGQITQRLGKLGSVSTDKSDEKENKTPMRHKGSGSVSLKTSSNHRTQSQRLKMHVQLFEQNCTPTGVENGQNNCQKTGTGQGNHHQESNSHPNSKKIECPKCARRSKSGTTTPAAPSRTPRRVVQSSKSSQELKKPIKSILKSDSRGSGSGSDKQSSMDSLGSASGIAACHVMMTRSDGGGSSGSGGGSRTKFNFNPSVSPNFSSGQYSPEEKLSKLKRIEKYATLRLKKPRVRPLDFGGSDDAVELQCGHNNKKNGIGSPGVPTDIMTKSMSFLEKSSTTGTNGVGEDGGCHNSNNNSSLKRQGSLRIRKPSPMWEPEKYILHTRTSALRMQKMQEAKNKGSGSKLFSGANHHHSGSNHSGSGESIHLQPSHGHSVGNVAAANNNNSGCGHNNNNTNSCNVSSGCHCTNQHGHHHQQRQSTNKEKHHHHQQQQQHGAKVFSKLSSAVGQTASSALKRVRQERGIQTEPVSIASPTMDDQSPIRISPVPIFEQGTDETEQIKNMEILAQRYRNTALRFQQEYEKSEEKNRKLLKQLQETQSETTEMIDFLQAEKSTLAESLIEVETEGKKWKEQADSIKKDAQARCSTLVRLSEQHKQEALKAQALLNRLEQLSGKKSTEMSESAFTIQQTRARIVTLIEKLLKTYKVPHELLASAINVSSHPSSGTKLDEAEMNSSLLLPLVSALMNVFPLHPSPSSSSSSKESHSNKNKNNLLDEDDSTMKANDAASSSSSTTTTVTVNNNSVGSLTNQDKSSSPVVDKANLSPIPNNNLDKDNELSNLSNSLQSLNQAILDREAAERLGLEDIDTISRVTSGLFEIQDGDYLSIKNEVDKLNRSLSKLVTVIRVIVIHCDKKVSGVTSNILQCLRSIEEEKGTTLPDMVTMKKSMEAWNNESGMIQHKDTNGSHVVSPTSNGHSHNM